MKKSIILIELIFTIVIISIVSIFTMTFIFNLYKKLSNDYTIQINKIEISTTHILLDKIFSNISNINITSSSMSFYKEDEELFDLGYYSRFVDLNSTDTTKNSLYTPDTYAEELIDYSITFDEIVFYTIQDNSSDNIIYLDDESTKEIKEHYKIISTNHKLQCKENILIYNDNILLENITNCNFTKSTDSISIEFFKDKIPIIWKYKL